jgi:hypothetical protein
MPIYAVQLHSTDGTLAGLGVHELLERPIEGMEITLNEETWTIHEVDETQSPPQVTLKRHDDASVLL